MIRSILYAGLALVAIASSTMADEAHNRLSEAEQASGWRLLFDGETTNGWRNYGKEGIGSGWVVENGELVRKERGAGDIVTIERFDSFELLLEYKISEGGNSGVMFHVQETEPAPWHTGPEVQILDNAGREEQKAGWLYQLYKPTIDPGTKEVTDATRPVGEWNQIHLLVTPAVCEINVNGMRYARFAKGSDDWNKRVAASKFADFPNFGKASEGHIALQDYGNLVAFRNIKVRRLPPNGLAPNPVDGELPLKPVLAFPNLEWDQWAPIDDRGRPQEFRPLLITWPDDGTNRLFVGEQNGRIFAFENRPDVTESTLLLDLTDKIPSQSNRHNEEGLLGLAIHPKFKENGYFYVFYTAHPGKLSIISRFTISNDDPNKADPNSELELMRIEQPFANHNGGTLVFGPDGYLYIAQGDGGSANDPFNNAQNLGTFLGKILRIDVDCQDAGKPYAIPSDNPFVGREGARPEIYAYGLRNPWRIAFDRETGDLWCGEVGQNLWEMIHIIEPGGNYGWNYREGTHNFGPRRVPDDVTIIPPVWEYDHGVGKSITGGFVYRGKKLPQLQGKYVYADYISGRIWALTYDQKAKKVVANEAIVGNQMPVLTFGDDAAGEIYFGITSPDGRGIYTFEQK